MFLLRDPFTTLKAFAKPQGPLVQSQLPSTSEAYFLHVILRYGNLSN